MIKKEIVNYDVLETIDILCPDNETFNYDSLYKKFILLEVLSLFKSGGSYFSKHDSFSTGFVNISDALKTYFNNLFFLSKAFHNNISELGEKSPFFISESDLTCINFVKNNMENKDIDTFYKEFNKDIIDYTDIFNLNDIQLKIIDMNRTRYDEIKSLILSFEERKYFG